MNESKAVTARRVILKGLAAGGILCLGWLLTTHLLSRPVHGLFVSWLPLVFSAVLSVIVFFAGGDPFWRWDFYTSIPFTFLFRLLLLRSTAVYRFVWSGGWGPADFWRDTPRYILLSALILTAALSFSVAFFQKQTSSGPPDIVPPLRERRSSPLWVVTKGLVSGAVFVSSWALTCHFAFSALAQQWQVDLISLAGMALCVLILSWRGTWRWGWSYGAAALSSFSVCAALSLSPSDAVNQFLFARTEFSDGLGNFFGVAVVTLSAITLRRKLLTAVFVLILREYKRIWIFSTLAES